MRRILIPTDFSENALNATSFALQFFEKEPITFHFLHIEGRMQMRNERDVYSAGVTILPQASKEAKTQMKMWMSRIRMLCSNPRHFFVETVIQATFIDGIREFVSKQQIEFIVMGTKGASGLKEKTIGGRTCAVITRVKCPILVIPENARFKTPLTLGFPTDFNMAYEPRIMSTLLRVCGMHGSSIKVLRVAQTQIPLDHSQHLNRELLKEQLNEIPHSFHLIENPRLEEALQLFVSSMRIDMVAMIAKNLNFFQRILFKPQLARISYHLHIPFLVLHE